VNPLLPAFRVAVFGDSVSGHDSIVFTPDTARATPTQTTALNDDFDAPDPRATDALRMFDLDADGYADLLVGKSWGATGNADYALWMFDSRTLRFVVDSSMPNTPFANTVPGRPCIWSSWNTSAYDDSNVLPPRRTLDPRFGGRPHVGPQEPPAQRYILGARGDSMVVTKTIARPDTT
jgi:hypothetical protein